MTCVLCLGGQASYTHSSYFSVQSITPVLSYFMAAKSRAYLTVFEHLVTRTRPTSGEVAAGQLDVQVISDVDLDELGQPHVVRHACEALG